jgi:protein-tyrosine phosphatase
MAQIAVLFVCYGNICRSPLAEAAFRLEAERAGLDAFADSAGTSDWHVGAPPDPRSQQVALLHGIDISLLRGRQVEPADFSRFTHIIAMDRGNLAALHAMRPRGATASLSLILDHVPGREGTSVADPYNFSIQAFDTTWTEVAAGAAGFVAALQNK